MHNLSTTLLPVTDSADKGPMIVSCTGEEGTHHVTWDILQQQSGLKQESPGHHIEANLLYKQESPGHHMEANLLYKQESPGHHMEANLLYKQESPGHHMEANLLYQVFSSIISYFKPVKFVIFFWWDGANQFSWLVAIVNIKVCA